MPLLPVRDFKSIDGSRESLLRQFSAGPGLDASKEEIKWKFRIPIIVPWLITFGLTVLIVVREKKVQSMSCAQACFWKNYEMG